MPGARDGRRAHPLEPGQAADDHRHDGFLARWARRLSWRETARTFQTSWEAVYHLVAWFVEWGLAHRSLEAVQAIGIEEIPWGQGKRADGFLTVIYQLDRQCRRLLWVGRRRTQATLRRGLKELGGYLTCSPRAALRVQRHVVALSVGDIVIIHAVGLLPPRGLYQPAIHLDVVKFGWMHLPKEVELRGNWD
jgi:hypothetical protein